jgi:hypothetical protein
LLKSCVVRYLVKATVFAVIGSLSSGLLFTTVNVGATPIGGEVSFAGSFVPNARIFGAMTRFDSFSDVTVTGTQGLYAGTESAAVTMNGFTFLDFTPPVLNEWEFTMGGRTYSFDLDSLHIDTQNRGWLVLSGTGVARITGYDPTPGTWSLTAYGSSKTFTATFDPPSANGAVEPLSDGGATTLGLLGFASVLLGLLRRNVVRKT